MASVSANEGLWAAQSNDVRGWVLSLVSGVACGEYTDFGIIFWVLIVGLD